MVLRMEMSDGTSNHSDFSNDSQSSQISGGDVKIEGGLLLTPTTLWLAKVRWYTQEKSPTIVRTKRVFTVFLNQGISSTTLTRIIYYYS
ncbi:hypothetical protein GWI33_006350 [Rhynchophorus ferrugineus]|uniref:Uncharacterized protein n=1 Tax=Rhynchophorus ferrugineus TaxID=354439 RepID=A0A834IHV0_RHYFE|nr:hypothetical protein GWI33_006350 [Rhynchophorus ferrugineus]